jgi:hypothetical protein
VLGPMHSPGVLGLPISDLLPQFQILTLQSGDLLTQIGDFALKLPYQPKQTSRLGGRERADKCVLHDADACNPNIASMERPTSS